MKNYLSPNLDSGWVVSLSDGRELYDWDRDTESGGPSWFELSDLIKSDESLRIVSMRIFYRPNFGDGGEFAGAGVPRDNAEGYFFSKRVSAAVADLNRYGENLGVGYLENEKVRITWFNNRVQALESEVRNREDCGFGLIVNNE